MFDIMIELGIYKYFVFCLGMAVLLSVMYFGLLSLMNLSKEDERHLEEMKKDREEAIRSLLDSYNLNIEEITGQNDITRRKEITHRLNRL